jgi:primosomal protein N' (replication factor Y)
VQTGTLAAVSSESSSRASILFPLPLPEAFDYLVPEGLELGLGDHVLAPLGQRMVHGVVWALKPGAGERALKAVEAPMGGAPLPAGTREFVDWVARYLVQPPGVILRSVLRSTEALKPSPTETFYCVSGAEPPRMTAAREAVLDAALALGEASAADIAREAGVGAGVVKGLATAGALTAVMRPIDPPYGIPDPEAEGLSLTMLQAEAGGVLRRLVRAGGFQAALLDGVTGSGKTEVYFEAIAEVLRRDPEGQILIMLPEIALTAAVLSRFEARFGCAPAIWHSAAGPKVRRRCWREVAEGRARIVVGARSALFLPFTNLKLIIVDEEHDPTYKQDEGLPYQGRDLAVLRAKIEGAMIVLASATPSLESLTNAQAGRYVHVRLPARPGSAVLPQVDTIDLRDTPPETGRWISPPLIAAMVETLQAGEQVLLYLNRRGYAPLVLCRACGHRMTSPDTQSYLVEHRYTGRLVCHVTGFSMPRPKFCPECKAEDSLTSVGPGVERVAEEAKHLFPDARIEIYSSDSASGADLVDRMERGEIDILVGTQIAAKGHNFPNLTLVGVIDADLGLAGGDPRAGERTFQTLVQVAGRAGRAERPGRALLQTHQPEHEAIQALIAGDRDAFLETEMMAREALGLPPFGRMAAISFQARDVQAVEAAAGRYAAAAPLTDGVEIWGPAEPPRALVRGWHRRRILVRADKTIDISAYLRAWKMRVKIPPSIRVTIDVDPYSFM